MLKKNKKAEIKSSDLIKKFYLLTNITQKYIAIKLTYTNYNPNEMEYS